VIDEEQKILVPGEMDWDLIVVYQYTVPVVERLVVKPASSHSPPAAQKLILVSVGTVHIGADETSTEVVQGMTVPGTIDW
jgi:hypothetical protein